MSDTPDLNRKIYSERASVALAVAASWFVPVFKALDVADIAQATHGDYLIAALWTAVGSAYFGGFLCFDWPAFLALPPQRRRALIENDAARTP